MRDYQNTHAIPAAASVYNSTEGRIDGGTKELARDARAHCPRTVVKKEAQSRRFAEMAASMVYPFDVQAFLTLGPSNWSSRKLKIAGP